MTSRKTENTYIFDAESATETARLMHQDRLMNRGFGGPFPEYKAEDLSLVHDILDIACGPGGWVIDVAYSYPHIQVTGIDISHRFIEYARTQARVQRLTNVHFSIANILQPLDFADQSFDIVNARLLFSVLPPAAWPLLLQECFRITRPGGIIRLTEWEIPMTNGAAFEEVMYLLTRTMYITERSFSPHGRTLGIAPMLRSFLLNVGCKDIQQKAHIMDFSSGTEIQESSYQNSMVTYRQAGPLFVKAGLITAEDYEILYQKMLAEMLQEDFYAISFFCTAWGRKPEQLS